MSAPTLTEVWSAGALVRRHMRVALDLAGIEWREHKGWTESQFVVTGDRARILYARNLLRQHLGAS